MNCMFILTPTVRIVIIVKVYQHLLIIVCLTFKIAHYLHIQAAMKFDFLT